jgi:hypothetical protein
MSNAQKIKGNYTAVILQGIKKALYLGNFRCSLVLFSTANIGLYFELANKIRINFVELPLFYLIYIS